MVLLCIMDGFGLREATPDNAVAAAFKPTYDNLMNTCPHTTLDGSGEAVGLPTGQMGNSEVGHLNLGAGRVIYQDISRIDRAIKDGSFFENTILVTAMKKIVSNNKALHLCGLVSDGGVHSSMNHLFALVKLAKEKGVDRLFLHAFMDGRDTPPEAGKGYMAEVLRRFEQIGVGQVATISGRYYGMDRDKRWERTDKAYRAIVEGEGAQFDDPLTAITSSYEKGVTDEFILPRITSSGNSTDSKLTDGDLAIFFNFRADRGRQLSYRLLGQQFGEYNHPSPPKVDLITMTEYDAKMTEAKVAFKRDKHDNILGGVLSSNGKKQLRTAETEKYPHVTFFFNGSVEAPFEGEDRDLIPSPKVATYDLQPEMSSVEVTDRALESINSGKYDFVLLNYANPDMVGHTGDFDAARKAVEAVDCGLARLIEAIEAQKGIAIVTADHGNAEMMIDPETGGPWTAHTTNLVPCILFDPSHALGDPGKVGLRPNGILADIAPTVLEMLDLSKPDEMTGESLLARG